MTYLGLDLGGSKLSSVMVDGDGKSLVGSYVGVGDESDIVEVLAEEISRWHPSQILAVGVGIPAWISNGLVVEAPHRQSLIGRNIAEELYQAIGVVTYVANDANMAGYLETTQGALRGCSCGVSVCFGTGVGIAVIMNGAVHGGAHGVAGELGHGRYISGSGVCSCGSKGCLELSLRENFILPQDSFKKVSVKRKKYLRGAATLLQWISKLLDPEVIVVGGGVIIDWESFVEDLKVELSELTPPRQLPLLPKVVVSVANEYSGALGAAIYGRDSRKGLL